MIDRERLREVADLNPPAAASQIDAAERELGCTFPEAYRQLLSVSNGLMAVNDHVLLYAAEELAERNRTFEVALYAPGWLMIGDDSGGRGFLIDGSGRDGRVLMVDHGSMVPSDGHPVASSLVEWLAAGMPDEDEWQ